MLHIVLVNPEIPANTGNIARLCVVNDLALHLVHPLGFRIEDRQLRRAGMDYWRHLDLHQHESLEAFLEVARGGRMWFFSSQGDSDHWDNRFEPGDWLVFGCESRGLPDSLKLKCPDHWVRIPMRGAFVRSLNLSSAVAIGCYHAMSCFKDGFNPRV